MYLLSKMCGAIETGKTPVGIHEAYDESDPTLLPASVVDKSGENEFGMLVRRGDRWHSDENHGK